MTDVDNGEEPTVITTTERTHLVKIYTALVVIAISVWLVVAFGWLYVGKVDHRRDAAEREADRRWCSLMAVMDDAYRANPPITETGRNIARQIHDLRGRLGCPASATPLGPLPTVTISPLPPSKSPGG